MRARFGHDSQAIRGFGNVGSIYKLGVCMYFSFGCILRETGSVAQNVWEKYLVRVRFGCMDRYVTIGCLDHIDWTVQADFVVVVPQFFPLSSLSSL